MTVDANGRMKNDLRRLLSIVPEGDRKVCVDHPALHLSPLFTASVSHPTPDC